MWQYVLLYLFPIVNEIREYLREGVTKIMARIDDLENALNTVGTNVDEIHGDSQQLLAEILDLKNGATAEKIDALATKAEALVAKTRATADLVPEPPPAD